MNLRRLARWLVAALISGGAATAAPPRAALVVGSTVGAVDVTDRSDPPLIDGTYRYTYRISETLVGAPRRGEVSEVAFGAERLPLDRYLLLDGDGHVVWSYPVAGGLCLDAETATEFGVEEAVRRLQNDRPCKDD